MGKIIQFQPNGKLGTDNIKTIFVVLLTIVAKIRALVKNFSTQGLVALAFDLLQYGNILSVARLAFDEFRSLNAVKAKEVKEAIKSEFDIPDDAFEATLEEALDLVADTYVWLMDGAGIGRRWVDYYETHLAAKDDNELPGKKQIAA